jgi:hypothetical protein
VSRPIEQGSADFLALWGFWPLAPASYRKWFLRIVCSSRDVQAF